PGRTKSFCDWPARLSEIPSSNGSLYGSQHRQAERNLTEMRPAAALLITFTVNAQFGPPPAPPRTGKAAALYDITGFWVSVVTEDWRYRIVTPLNGDYNGILLNPVGRKIADAW